MSKKSLLLPVYLPTFFMSFGGGMLTLTLPLYAKSFNVSYSLVSIAVAAVGLGTLLADIPAGMLIERLGRKPVMIIGLASLAITSFALGISKSFPQIILYRFIAGVGSAMWGISRHTYITDVIPVTMRGRALASFGGINRIGSFAGPAVGGYLGYHYGLRAPFFVHGSMAAITVLISAIFIIETKRKTSVIAQERKLYLQRFIGLLKQHYQALASAGSAQMFAQMIRAGRQIIIPLYGSDTLGLDPKAVGLVMSISGAIDMVMFFPAGVIMDRLGRRYTSIPSFLIMSLGMAIVPFSKDFLGFLIATLIIGFGNGLGSGIMMTLGADLAPKHATGEFLGIWRLIGDVGDSGGPLVVGGIADLYGLSFAAFTLAGVGFLSSAVLFLFVRETLTEKVKGERRRAK